MRSFNFFAQLLGVCSDVIQVKLIFHPSSKGLSVDLALPPGVHQYKFEVDGVSRNDPSNSMVR